MNTPVTPPTLTADDIPMEFTLEGLREHFSDDEIRAMNEGDDPILPGVDLTAPPTDADGAPEGEGGADPNAEGDTPVVVDTPAVVPPVVLEEPDPPAPVTVDVSAQKATVDAMDTKIAALQEQYDDGDLTSEEWRAQLSALVREQAAAQAALDAAEAQMADAAPKAEAYREAWFSKVDAYAAQHPYLMTPEHYDNWDAALKMVNANGAYQNLPMAQRIQTAHRIYSAHYESIEGKPLPTSPGLTTAQKAEAAKPTIPGPRTDPRPEAPTTLADLTNANDGGLEDGRFAQIDRIADSDPIAAERMVAALSDADRAAYLSV